MASLKSSVLVCLAVIVLVLQSSEVAAAGSDFHRVEGRGRERGLVRTIDCGAACRVRCSKASRQKRCEFVCGSCCNRCNCVPPGTYGNKEACPCYASITTNGGKPKCP